jgi:hypothetical protein
VPDDGRQQLNREEFFAMSKVNMICKSCGGTNVMHDAWAVWNVETQEWELGTVFDYAHCEDCDGECSIKEIEIDD